MWVFGEDEFQELQNKQNFYLVEFALDTPFKLFGHFSKFEQSYPIYTQKFYKDGYDVASFTAQIAQIYAAVNSLDKYKFFYQLQSNEVFMRNEFRRMCYLIRDIYHRGTFHRASTFWPHGDMTICSHPGNHLLFTLMMLGRPVEAFFTVEKQHSDFFFETADFIKVIQHIQTLPQLEAIIGTQYTAWLQDAGILVPALVRKDTNPLWQRYDRTGFLLWPELDRVVEWAEHQWWYTWYGDVCEGRTDLSQHIEVKENFASVRELYGNLLGFLMNSDRSGEDSKFKVLNYSEKPKLPMEDFLQYKDSYKEFNYYGNRHTQAENWLT